MTRMTIKLACTAFPIAMLTLFGSLPQRARADHQEDPFVVALREKGGRFYVTEVTKTSKLSPNPSPMPGDVTGIVIVNSDFTDADLALLCPTSRNCRELDLSCIEGNGDLGGRLDHLSSLGKADYFEFIEYSAER